MNNKFEKLNKLEKYDKSRRHDDDDDDDDCHDDDDGKCTINKYCNKNYTTNVNVSSVLAYSDFFGLMPPDNAATVVAGTAVSFPQNGPSDGTITRMSTSTFNLSNPGTFEVTFQASVAEPGQLVIAINDGSGFVELPNTVVGRATGTTQIMGTSLIKVTTKNVLLSIRNPTGNTPALTLTPVAGGSHPVSCHLVIKQLA